MLGWLTVLILLDDIASDNICVLSIAIKIVSCTHHAWMNFKKSWEEMQQQL